jgi:hypothetical protein
VLRFCTPITYVGPFELFFSIFAILQTVVEKSSIAYPDWLVTCLSDSKILYQIDRIRWLTVSRDSPEALPIDSLMDTRMEGRKVPIAVGL